MDGEFLPVVQLERVLNMLDRHMLDALDISLDKVHLSREKGRLYTHIVGS